MPYDTARCQLVAEPVATGHFIRGGVDAMEVIEVYGGIKREWGMGGRWWIREIWWI